MANIVENRIDIFTIQRALSASLRL